MADRMDGAARRRRVVIVGGGFAGLSAARALARKPVDVTVIDHLNHHLFQPLLYQVATGVLNAGDIASPLRQVLRAPNTTVLLGDVQHVDLQRKVLECDFGERPFDDLIIATGATHSYFNHPEWERDAPALKTLEDAFEV